VKDAKKNIPGGDDPNFAQFEQELMAMARSKARQVTAKFGPRLEILKGKHKPLLKAYERISKDYDEHSAKIKRSEPSVELSRGKYYILMLLFVLGEIPMNSLAFAVFGENQIFTWVMAIGVAVAIPWIAHALGILFKRWAKPMWKSAVPVGALLFLTIGGLIAIGYVRVQYLGDLNVAAGGSGFSNSTFIGAAFVGLNLVILAAATLCSYFAHDKDPHLEHLHRKTNHINKEMRALEGKFKKILHKEQQKLHRVQQKAQEIIYYYRKTNQRWRPDHGKPKSFDSEHELGVELEKEKAQRQMETMTTRFQTVANQPVT
jgi:hypothetical protein